MDARVESSILIPEEIEQENGEGTATKSRSMPIFVKFKHADKTLLATLEMELEHEYHSVEIGSAANTLPTKCRIHKVPVDLHKGNEDAYTPRVVSIGPIHYCNESLQKMGKLKYGYLKDLLRENQNRGLKDYVNAIKELEKEARHFYEDEYVSNLTSDEFVRMMLFDGCFIVMFIHKYWKPQFIHTDGYIYNIQRFMNIKRDMMLLENQLPFIIIKEIWKLMVGNEENVLSKLILELFRDTLGFAGAEVSRNERVLLNYHILHLVRESVITSSPRLEPENRWTTEDIMSVKKLREARVKFKIGPSSNFLNIRFTTNGVLEIPRLIIEEDTEILFRNFIAYEQCNDVSPSYFTDYAILMDMLIKSPDDVGLLCQHGIIMNYLGEDEAVSRLFKNLCKGTVWTDEFYYHRLCEDLNDYSKTFWNIAKVNFMQKYFYTPWPALSVIAAVTLLILTVIQTVVAIVSLTLQVYH